MNALCSLPQGLLVLLLALPALSTGLIATNVTTKSNATSPSDPFRILRLRATTRPSEPICCLTPLSPEPLPTTAEFLSFEEWKSKQRELQAQAQAANQTPSPDVSAPEAPIGASAAPSTTNIGDPDLPIPLTDSVQSFSPHFRVPLTDRFNYASLDCSARIHSSHRSARSPSSILSSKRDKYMLSPCSTDPHFVVIELCDDIRIDTVQLANFEFFSGVFRDFKVSVAQTYTSDGQGWVVAGTYRARNIRGVQSFHPLVELRPFYRFIRIDFLSHYGNEFYCPISLLRVYGLTQMEEWKWEVWQSESESTVAQTLPELEKAHGNAETKSANETVKTETNVKEHNVVRQEEILADIYPQTKNTPVSRSYDSQTSSSELHTGLPPSSPQQTVIETPAAHIISPQRTTTHETVEKASLPATPISQTASSDGLQANSSLFTNISLSHANATGASISTNAIHSASSSSGSSVQILVSLPSASPAPSGESIYRTIMNRLGMLETNTTLYQRYVEEQTLQIREALRRLEEDVGRLEGISKSQQQIFSKTMQDLDLRRRQMDEERWELLNKINHLSDEVILEKRLGIAQLCLLLTVLVFMALTRGSRVALLDGTMHRFNSFSRHRKWSSADWSLTRSLSRSRTPTPLDYVKKEPKEEGLEVTITSAVRHEAPKPSLVPFPTTPARSQTPRSPTRRPTTPRRQDIMRISNESRPTGRLRRSNSHTTPASVMLSAKRLARTAHLHEVPLFTKNREAAGGDVDNPGHSPLVPGDGSPKPKRKTKEYPNIRAPKPASGTSGGGESDAGSWVDTESGIGSDPDSDGDESEDGHGQEVAHKSEFDFGSDRAVPMISAPPSRRREQFKGHTPPSPASVLG